MSQQVTSPRHYHSIFIIPCHHGQGSCRDGTVWLICGTPEKGKMLVVLIRGWKGLIRR